MIWTPQLHHHAAVWHLKEHPRAALFAGMGLGKTSSVLQAFNELWAEGKSSAMLVVAPLRVSRLTWPHEVQKWDQFRWMKTAVLRTQEGWTHLENRDAQVYLINYESLPWLCYRYLAGTKKPPFDIIVFDESTKAKNPASQRIRKLRKYLKHFSTRWILTGTPNPNNLMELWAQYRLLDDGERLGTAFSAYRNRYFEAEDYMKYTWRLRPGSDRAIHAAIHDITLVLRSADFLEIEDTITEDIEVPLPAKAKNAYEELERTLLAMLEEDVEVVAVNAAALVSKLLQITGGHTYYAIDPLLPAEKTNRAVAILHDAKIKALEAFMKRYPGENFLVATQFRHEHASLVKAIPGAVSFQGQKDEAKTLRDWNEKRIKVLVADPRSIGHGLNLQYGGRICVWYSQTWSRELYDQFNARLARTGQTRVPIVARLVSPGTMDDAVIETLREKHEGQTALQQALLNFKELKTK